MEVSSTGLQSWPNWKGGNDALLETTQLDCRVPVHRDADRVGIL